ncbi:hypothetical protein OH77DRAFT_1487924 [Trametes cingulata]|nr:hypothetical protein OH77DRAFT_1487924 [Trametes cingulata]
MNGKPRGPPHNECYVLGTDIGAVNLVWDAALHSRASGDTTHAAALSAFAQYALRALIERLRCTRRRGPGRLLMLDRDERAILHLLHELGQPDSHALLSADILHALGSVDYIGKNGWLSRELCEVRRRFEEARAQRLPDRASAEGEPPAVSSTTTRVVPPAGLI